MKRWAADFVREELGIPGCRSLLHLDKERCPKKPEETRFHTASWLSEDYRHAEDAAKRVIREIRLKIFWPPKSPPPQYAEIYAAICPE